MTRMLFYDEKPKLMPILPGWLASALLLGLALLLAPVSGPLARLFFVAGSIAVGWYAWRQGPAYHLQAMLVLFSFAPFARRVVDLSAGFDTGGIMLVGPLLALLVAVPRLLSLLDGRSNPLENGLAPLTIAFCCVVYAAMLSAFQGAWSDVAAGALKWMAPLLYAAALVETGERDRLVRAAVSAFMVILPLTGLYGAFQYVDPPEWDRYWMQFATAVTAGLPLPYEIRVYGTMNGPASFATFTAAGLLLVSFLRPVWVSCLVCGPAILSLMLSQYRTAWISLFIGLLFCVLFSATRVRAGVILLAMFGAGMFTLTMPPFSDVLEERLATLGEGSEDGSFQERLAQFVTLWNQPDSSLFGVGFTTADAGVAGAMPVDGMFIACWLMMGIAIGLVCLAAFIWACGRMIASAAGSGRPEAIVLGGLGCGALLQMPLASLASGELGFLFWTFAALACRPGNRHGIRAHGG